MAVAVIERPSWPDRPVRGHNRQGRDRSDRAQPDQGPAQEVIGEMAWLLRDTRRRTQVADTWTYIAAAYFLLWTVVILLGL
jgi:hypothetical protein